MTNIPPERIRVLRSAPPRSEGDYILYWMVGSRRLAWNHALDRALELARAHDRPLVILEALRVGYRWASDRHHAFAIQGMADQAAQTRSGSVLYYPYVEPEPGAGSGLLEALARDSVAVVTDWTPVFFLPRMVRAAARRIDRRMEAVDSCGLVPLAAPPKTFGAAVHFRRYLQRTLHDHFGTEPDPSPLSGPGIPSPEGLPASILRRWPRADGDLLDAPSDRLGSLDIDHTVRPVPRRGGSVAARAELQRFVEERLHRYAEERADPDGRAASNLSPYLHWGHLSTHEVFETLAEREGWTPGQSAQVANGKRTGWWGMSPEAESFLDELVTWRELGYLFCDRVSDYDDYGSLPEWARDTLDRHTSDPRDAIYSLDEFAAAATHDPIWNAAQRQLLEEGIIHNYVRMLWGKKILEWSPDPREAFRIMIELNNRYAIDGRDPNSYSGIAWVMGRFDRGWPERPVFGKVRSMSSEQARKKVRMEEYLTRFG